MLLPLLFAISFAVLMYNTELAKTQSFEHALMAGKRFLRTMLFVWLALSLLLYTQGELNTLIARMAFDGFLFAGGMSFLYFWHMHKTRGRNEKT